MTAESPDVDRANAGHNGRAQFCQRRTAPGYDPGQVCALCTPSLADRAEADPGIIPADLATLRAGVADLRYELRQLKDEAQRRADSDRLQLVFWLGVIVGLLLVAAKRAERERAQTS